MLSKFLSFEVVMFCWKNLGFQNGRGNLLDIGDRKSNSLNLEGLSLLVEVCGGVETVSILLYSILSSTYTTFCLGIDPRVVSETVFNDDRNRSERCPLRNNKNWRILRCLVIFTCPVFIPLFVLFSVSFLYFLFFKIFFILYLFIRGLSILSVLILQIEHFILKTSSWEDLYECSNNELCSAILF